MFENIAIQGIHNTAISNAPTAMLWIFSPRSYSIQAKRPLTYSFNPAFGHKAEEAVAKKTTQGQSSLLTTITQNPEFLSAIQPTFMPDHIIDTRPLSMNWTFMLITNNDKTDATGTLRSMSDNQHLYYGYFVDEPVNPSHHMGKVTPNPNAQLIITHKTQINRLTHVGAYGQQNNLTMMADIDIIHPQLTAMISTRTDGTAALTGLMRPEELYASTAAGPVGDLVVMYDEKSQLHNMGGPTSINSALSVPRHNIKKILDGVADTQQSLINSAFEGHAISSMNRETFDFLLEQNLQDGGRLFDQGLPVQHVIIMGYVLDRYRPAVNVIEQDRHPHYDPIDQTTGSHRNVFSSMLATVVPAIMAEMLLADVTFSYNSHAGGDPILSGIPAAMTELPMNELEARVRGFLHRMRMEIFPILTMTHGDFNLTMHCTCGGVTHINLNFFSDSTASREIFEVPTILGGFNTPLIGTADAFDHNARELALLISHLSDTDRDLPLSQYENHQLDRGLLTYDTQTMRPLSQEPPNPSLRKWQV
jgi:hypothetical protein